MEVLGKGFMVLSLVLLISHMRAARSSDCVAVAQEPGIGGAGTFGNHHPETGTSAALRAARWKSGATSTERSHGSFKTRQLCLSIFLLLLGYAPVQAQAPEYQVKAAMLANFALFVNWPANAFPSPGSPFVVCVVGDDPFGPWLKSEMGERVGSHAVEIRQMEKPQNVRSCHLVFISRSEQSRLKQVLAQFREGHALIVSDTNRSGEFCREGGMIALTTEGRKVRFELNSNAVARAGLGMDSKVKRVARSTSCGGS